MRCSDRGGCHGSCFQPPPFPHPAGAAPASAVAELGVVRRRYAPSITEWFLMSQIRAPHKAGSSITSGSTSSLMLPRQRLLLSPAHSLPSSLQLVVSRDSAFSATRRNPRALFCRATLHLLSSPTATTSPQHSATYGVTAFTTALTANSCRCSPTFELSSPKHRNDRNA